MRIISICRSIVWEKLHLIRNYKERRPNFLYISESTRKLIPRLGYSNPYDFADKYSI